MPYVCVKSADRANIPLKYTPNPLLPRYSTLCPQILTSKKIQREQLKKKFYNQRKRLREKKGVSDEERQAREAAREEQEAAEIAELTAAWEQYGGCPEGARAQQKANESSYAGVRDDKGGFASGPPRPAPPRQDYYALEDPNSDYYMDEMPPEPMQPAGYQEIANTDYSPHEHRDGHAAYQSNYQHQNASQNQNNYQQDVQIGDGANQQLQFGATAMDDFITADLWDDMPQPNVQQLLDLNAPPYSPLFLMCCKCSNEITPFADPPPPHQYDSPAAPNTEAEPTPQDLTNQTYPEPMDTSEPPKTPVLTPDEFDLSSELDHELFGLDTPGSLPDDGPDGGFHPYPSNPATSILFFPETSETSPQYLNTAVAAGKPDVSDGSSVEELRPRNVDSQVFGFVLSLLAALLIR